MKTFLRALSSVVMIAVAITAAGCGASIDQPKGSSSNSGAKLNLQWPKGYSYDSATKQLKTPISALNLGAAPVYVTSIILTVSGPEMDTMSVNVPLDTLTAQFTLTFGERRFDVLVQTDFGVTFTGSTVVPVGPNSAPDVYIALEVNSPPKIEKVSISNNTPQPGETVTISAITSDLDPNDTLTYTWEGTGPDGTKKSFSGPSITETMPSAAGQYTITLTVDDGHGGIATASFALNVSGLPPVIDRIDFSNTAPKTGDTVTVYGVAHDPDINDTLTYDWTITTPSKTSFTMTGKTISVALSTGGSYTFELMVTDSQKHRVTSTATLSCGCTGTLSAPANVTAAAHPSKNGGINVSWSAVTGAAVYNVKVFDGTQTLITTKNGLSNTSTTFVDTAPVGGIRYYAVSAGDYCNVMGAYSANVGPVTAPGVAQPINLGKQTISLGNANLGWTATNTSTGYTIYWQNTTTGTSGTQNGTGTPAACPVWLTAGPSCFTAAFSCTGGENYNFAVTETNGTYTSVKSAQFAFICPP